MTTSWVEPSLILSGASSPFRPCMYHYHSIFLSLTVYSHIFFTTFVIIHSSYPVICLVTCWMEPSLIRSGTSSPFNTCMCDYHSIFHLNNSYSLIFSSQFFPLLIFSSAIWVTTSWVEPSLIRSGTLPIFSICMCHDHCIFHSATLILTSFYFLLHHFLLYYPHLQHFG